MRPPSSSRQRLRPLALAGLLLALGLSAQARPPEPDALAGLLKDKGLVMPAAGMMTQVRESTAELVMTAMNFLDVPYRLGGNSADEGFDCSGFTRHIFERTLGVSLPRRAQEQARAPGLVAVPRTELQPGDLVFFNTLRRTFSHVGIYIGEGRFIHAPRTGAHVRVESMRSSYWLKRFNGARRAAHAPPAMLTAADTRPAP